MYLSNLINIPVIVFEFTSSLLYIHVKLSVVPNYVDFLTQFAICIKAVFENSFDWTWTVRRLAYWQLVHRIPHTLYAKPSSTVCVGHEAIPSQCFKLQLIKRCPVDPAHARGRFICKRKRHARVVSYVHKDVNCFPDLAHVMSRTHSLFSHTKRI